jgi:hypothetical protein
MVVLEFRRRGKRLDVVLQKDTTAGDSSGGGSATTF